MYSPTTRLLTVLELLQSYKQMSGPEMARRLEIDVRTVRRYIVMLQDIGIPVESARGPSGTYKLKRGPRLPPLMFSDAEAIAITLGLLAIREFRFPVEVAAVEGALAKTERVMPEKLLEQTRSLQEAIVFNVATPAVQPQNELVLMLSRAVQQRQRVSLRYRARDEKESEREFDPYGIAFNEGYWQTVGFCHLRQDLRMFRLDRIVTLIPTEQSFERPENFDVLEYVVNSMTAIRGANQIEVIFKTTLERAQQVIPASLGILESSEKGVVLRRSAIQLEWLAHLLLNLDFPVVVVKPLELREILRQMAVKALHMLDEDQ